MGLNYAEIERHRADIAEFWKARIDFERGGVYCNDLKRQGAGSFNAVWRSTARRILSRVRAPAVTRLSKPDVKCLLMHARQLYNYSAAAEVDLPNSLAIAQHLYETIDVVFPKQGAIYPSFESAYADGLPDLYRHPTAYNQFFAVTGIARYAKTTADTAAFEKAFDHLNNVLGVFEDHDWRRNGVFRFFDGTRCYQKSGDVHLHLYEALVVLYDASNVALPEKRMREVQSLLRDSMDDMEKLFRARVYDSDTGLPRERFDALDRPRSERVFLGHALEWWGFQFEAEQLTGCRNEFLRRDGRSLLDKCVELGMAASGCFRSTLDTRTGEVSDTTDFWTQIEAVLALCFAHRCFGERRYLALAEQAWEFYTASFIDGEGGGVYTEISVAGSVVDARKGSIWKCDFHASRVCERILRYRLLG